MDWNRYKEDGVMRAFKAECLDGVCRNGFTSKILNRGPLAVRHTLLRARPLMGWKGVSNKSLRSGSVEAALDAILVLQRFCRDLFEKIGFWVRRTFALQHCWGWQRRRGWRRRRRWPRLNR